jgi:hypothetical protein
MSNGRNDDDDKDKDPDKLESDPVQPPHLLWAAAAGGLIGGLIGALIGTSLG